LEIIRLSGADECYSKCRSFKCTKRALTYRGKTGWCTWINEPCDPKKCINAVCIKRQLLPEGKCGFTIKRKTREDIRPEDMFKEEIRVREKLAKKTGERSIF
jgi:hypothetical protein